MTRLCVPPSVLALLLAVASPASAGDGVIEINHAAALAGIGGGDVPGYPVSINQPGSYRLTSSLVMPDANTNAIAIQSTSATRTTVDLGGFSIVGPASCTGAGSGISCTGIGIGIGVQGGGDVTVRNGFIVGAGARGIALGADARIEDLTVRSCGAIGITCGAGCAVTRVLSQQNGNNGMSVGPGAQVTNSALRDNGFHGLNANSGASNVRYNAVVGNAFIGVVAFDGATVVGNVLRGNGTWGLSASVGADSGWAQNVFTANGTGAVTGGVNLGGNACNGAPCP